MIFGAEFLEQPETEVRGGYAKYSWQWLMAFMRGEI